MRFLHPEKRPASLAAFCSAIFRWLDRSGTVSGGEKDKGSDTYIGHGESTEFQGAFRDRERCAATPVAILAAFEKSYAWTERQKENRGEERRGFG